MCVDSVYMNAFRFDAEAAYRWDNLRISIPLRYSSSYDYELEFAEAGLLMSVYPFHGKGFYIGASMVRLGCFWGLEAPEERLILFSEIIAGWTLTFSWFFIEPRLSLLDAFSSEEGRLGMLEKAVPQYAKLRFSLIAGATF